MPIDPFRPLRAMAEHAGVFAGGHAQAEAAAASIFAAAAKTADKARLAIMCGAIGADDFDALADGLKPGEVKSIVDRIEGAAKPARTQATALASLKRIARGVAPPPVPDLAALDLAALRTARETLGDGFEAWLAGQGAKSKPALQRLDPHLARVAAVTPARARPRLAELARGAEPTPAPAEPPFRLADLDADGLRRARSELGDRFVPWIASHGSAALKAALVRIDRLRPNVKRLPKADYPFLLGEIASGASLFTTDEDTPPIGGDTFSMRDG